MVPGGCLRQCVTNMQINSGDLIVYVFLNDLFTTFIRSLSWVIVADDLTFVHLVVHLTGAALYVHVWSHLSACIKTSIIT